jgi:methyl halide transferase
MSSDQVKKSVMDARARLQKHFQEYPGEKYGEGWENLWTEGDFLPWDKGSPNPALIDTLKEHEDIIGNAMVERDGKVRRKKALVPGCGRGVDVLLLKSFGYEAIGLEYSETAVKACHDFEEQHGSEYHILDEKLGEGTAKFVVGDFFRDDWLTHTAGSEKTFDLIYDYTVRNCSPPTHDVPANMVLSSSSVL